MYNDDKENKLKERLLEDPKDKEYRFEIEALKNNKEDQDFALTNKSPNKESDDIRQLDKKQLLQMFNKISKNSSCYVFTSLSFFLIQTVNLIFLGHSSSETNIRDINVSQMGNIFINLFGFIFCIGSMNSFDTLGSHAFSRKDFNLFYDIFHSARIFSILIFLIFMLPICFSIHYLLYLLAFDAEFITLCSSYIRVMLISVTLNLFHLINGKLLQIMGYELLVMGIYIVTLLIHIILCLFFIFVFQYGLYGIAICSAISSAFALVTTTFFVYTISPFKGAHKCIITIDTDSLNTSKFFIYAKIGIISGFIHFIYDLRFDLIVFLTYYLDPISLSTNVVIYNYITLLFHILLGFCFPITQMIRYYLGKFKFDKARLFINGIYIISTAFALIISFFNYLSKYTISWVYVSNPIVAQNFAYVINLYCIMIFIHWGNNIINFVLKGVNKHRDVNILSSFFFIFIFLPIGVFLAFALEMGYAAFWYVTFAHMISFSIIQISYICYLNTEKTKIKIVKEIHNLVEDEDIFFK